MLGQGSFGITYLATCLGPFGDIYVAIKEFFMSDFNGRRPDGTVTMGAEGGLVARYGSKFCKEADHPATLRHDGIVRVGEVFDANGTHYYAMNYIDCGNRDNYLKQCGPLPEGEALSVTRRLAEALSCMHDKHMLHLDVKPKNVILPLEEHEGGCPPRPAR